MWQASAAITDEGRASFTAEVAEQRARLMAERNLPAAPTPEKVDELERRAVAGALEACGYLTRQEVRRAPRPRKRKPRESLERGLRRLREQAGAAGDETPLVPACAEPSPSRLQGAWKASRLSYR